MEIEKVIKLLEMIRDRNPNIEVKLYTGKNVDDLKRIWHSKVDKEVYLCDRD